MSDRPIHRAHRITIEAGADTQDELIATLKQIIFDIQRGSTGATSGSPSAGYHFSYVVDPEMTHERYFALIDTLADRLMEVERGDAMSDMTGSMEWLEAREQD